MKPEFVDNRGENTLANALMAHMQWLRETYARPLSLSIATGYFNPSGFGLLADCLEDLEHIRLLIGAEPAPPPAVPKRKPGDPRGAQYDAMLVRQGLQALESGLEQDRDLLGFSTQVDRDVTRLLRFLQSGKIEVRRYERQFLHGKAFIFSGQEGVIAGSSNFTRAGLTSNMELNLGRYDPHPVQQVQLWFDDLWADAVPYDLSEIYRSRFVEYDPYLLYLRVLWELYGDELQEEHGTISNIHLTGFQQDGLFRARQILDRFNGVIVADGVGLGKSFIAGELIKDTIQNKRQRVVLISPASLRDGTWERFCLRYAINPERLSYEELAIDDIIRDGVHPHLQFKTNEYALIIVDEAQAFRNPATHRAKALRQLLRGAPPKKLMLLTATPVNNSLWDLYNLLTYFVGHDAVFADRGIPSLKQHFQDAVGVDPYDLTPDMLFDILDQVVVRRTRHFVKRYYPEDKIPGPDGEMIPIRFPDPHVRKVSYELDQVLPGFFDEFARELVPDENNHLGLRMARYCPSKYLIGGSPVEHELALAGLLRSGLLKRFESSVYAFSETCRHMADSHDTFLDVLDHGFIPTPDALQEWGDVDNDEAFEALLLSSGSVPTAGYDVESLRVDVIRDRDLLNRFADIAGAVAPASDPKLTVLADELAEIAHQAETEGIGPDDTRNRRKVIIFSYYLDTLVWIEQYLQGAIDYDPLLAVYRDRMACVTSEDNHTGLSRREAIFGFAPISTEAPPLFQDDRFDILLTTDVLAEGHNLQQCRNIINYDLPWNPMRLVQRNGRIDRIGSPHKDVYLRVYFPDRRLEQLLDLEDRIRRKLAQAAASIGVENEVIPEGAVNDVVFAETTQEIEALRREDPTLFITGGEDPTAHSGEEYRQELRRGMEIFGRQIRKLPWAVGSGLAQGRLAGHFFCARIGDKVFLRFVPLNAERPENIVRETLSCLRTITCVQGTPRVIPDEMKRAAYQAWVAAQADIYNSWMLSTDPANLQPKIRPLFRDIADHLRRYPPAGMTQDELARRVESIEAPWGIRVERQFRDIFKPGSDSPARISRSIIEKIDELGLQPYVPPEPLPVIEQDDVKLICWLVVQPIS